MIQNSLSSCCPRSFRRGRRSAFAFLLPAAVIASLAIIATPQVEAQNATTPVPAPQKEDGPFVMPEVSEALAQTGSQEEVTAKIVELLGLMPESLRQPKNMTIEQLHTLVDTAISLSRIHEQRFPEGAGRKEWLPGIARLYVVNNTRFFVAMSNAFKEQTGRNMTQEEMAAQRGVYWDQVLTMIGEALKLNPEAGSVNEEMLATQGQASWFSQRYDQAVKSYETLLERYPESDRRSEYLLALLNAHLSARRYDIAVKLCDRFLNEFPRDALAPHVYQLKAKALLEAGRAEEALAWWLEVQPTLVAASEGKPISIGGEPYVFDVDGRKAFRRYADEGLFMLGFLRGFLGDVESARTSFELALTTLNELQERNILDPRSAVFRSRTEKVNTAYLTLVSEPIPNFEISTWLDSIPFDTELETGNVQVLAFLPYDNPRYFEFLTVLQQLSAEFWHEGLRVTWVADPKGFSDPEGQVEKLSKQRDTLGLGFPIGLETERGWPNFRKFQASVGGGTLIVADRSGKVVWYKMDPTYRDENLVKRLVRRLLDEQP